MYRKIVKKGIGEKMKKTAFIICMLLLVLTASCGSESAKKEWNEEATATTKKTETQKVDYSNGEGEESIPCFWGEYMAASQNGYYYWSFDGSNQLRFFDREGEVSVPVCNKAECEHNTEDCNAYYPKILLDTKENDTYASPILQFYEGSIYTIGCDSQKNICLYQISADGSERKKVVNLYRVDFLGDTWESPTVWLHKGYVYYVDVRERKQKLAKKKLKSNAEEEIVFQTENDRSEIYRIKSYDNSIYFQVAEYTEDETKGNLYCYDTQKEHTDIIKEKVIAPYGVIGKKVYYASTTGNYCYDIESKKEIMFSEKSSSDYPDELETFGEYIYIVSDDKKLNIYDTSGEIVYQGMPDKQVNRYYLGDDKRIFANVMNEEGNPSLMYLSLDQIDVKQISWKEVDQM